MPNKNKVQLGLANTGKRCLRAKVSIIFGFVLLDGNGAEGAENFWGTRGTIVFGGKSRAPWFEGTRVCSGLISSLLYKCHELQKMNLFLAPNNDNYPEPPNCKISI